MDAVITPEPHFIPGYTGHCPQFRFRQGKTYGQLSHKLMIDPCIKHAPELILPLPTQSIQVDYPTDNEVKSLKDRSGLIDSIYNYPIIPGYDGFVPNIMNKTGKSFGAAAKAGIAEHEILMERLRCEKHFLEHFDLLHSGNGRFGAKLRERMMPLTQYRAPLTPVTLRNQALKIESCKIQKEKMPHSKYTVPHFMEKDDKEKYIVKGYGGHIPMTMSRFGQSNKQLTNSALVEFTNNYHHHRHRQSAEWCPMEMTGVATSCPNNGQFSIYHRTIGMVPSYSGHVPGKLYSFGRTYGNATIDAKRWLALNKD